MPLEGAVAGGHTRCPWQCVLWRLGAGAGAECRCRVPLLDVYGSVRFGAWVLVPLQGAAHEHLLHSFAIWGLC